MHWLPELSVATVVSPYGRVACLLERGRCEWHQLRQDADYLAVADVAVLVVNADESWALRRILRPAKIA